jgi:deoxycytidine triphosphate deaminase
MQISADLASALSDPIPVLSNVMLEKLVASGLLRIDYFKKEMLGPTSYRIRPKKVRHHRRDEDEIILADGEVILGPDRSYSMGPGEYIVFSPEESFFLGEGMVADFYPSSWCVERNLCLTAGRLDANYHNSLVFGLYNAGRSDVEIKHVSQLARVTFGWLGSKNMPDYSGSKAGSYIDGVDRLRGVSAAFEELAEQIRNRQVELLALIEKNK